MLSEFTFPRVHTEEEAEWRTKSRQVVRTLILSRNSPEFPPWATWLLSAAWVAIVGLLLSLAVMVTLGITAESMWDASLLVWLAAHQATVITPDGMVSLLPIGLAVIPLPLWRRASRWLEVQYSGRQGARRRALILSLTGYVSICTVGALSLRSNDVRVSVLATVVGATSVALLGIVWGIRKQSPERLRLPNALAGGTVAVAWFLVVGSVVLAVSVVFSLSDISVARQSLAEDAVGQLGVLAVDVAYLPNVIIWMAAYATGAGISVGGDQHVSMFVAEQALLPDLPVLAAMPVGAPAGAAFLPIIIVIGGWLSATVAQRQAPLAALRRRLARAAVLAGMILLFWLVAMIISGGSLGDGRLDYVGPALSTPFAAAALVGIGATLWALVPTLTSDARPFVRALRGRFDKHIGTPDDTEKTRSGHDGNVKPRADAVSR